MQDNGSAQRKPRQRVSQMTDMDVDSKSISVVTAGHSNIQIIEQEYGADHDSIGT